MESFDNKVFIVTGAAGGIGMAITKRLVEAGAHVVACDSLVAADGAPLSDQARSEARSSLSALGSRIVLSEIDLRLDSSAQDLVALAEERFGGIDGAVCAAGIQRDAPVARMAVDDFRAVLETSLVAPLRLLQTVARALIDRERGGSIVLMTGANALFGSARQANLASAWAGVMALTRTAATELRRHRIRVNAVAPTARTRANEHLPMFQGVQPTSLLAEHVAPLVSYLLSDGADHITGELLGAAGNRFYALRARETTGATMRQAPAGFEELAAAWTEITRT